MDLGRFDSGESQRLMGCYLKDYLILVSRLFKEIIPYVEFLCNRSK